MSGSLSLQVVCRDLSLLPEGGDFKPFFENVMVPAIFEEIQANRAVYLDGWSAGVREVPSPELGERGCSIGGSLSIKF